MSEEGGKEGAHHGKSHFDALFEHEITPLTLYPSPSPVFLFFFFSLANLASIAPSSFCSFLRSFLMNTTSPYLEENRLMLCLECCCSV